MIKVLRSSLMALVTTLLLLPMSQAADFEPGVHYREIAERQPTRTGDKIEVLELFWYRCPHCFNLERPLKEWLKRIPDNAAFVHMPAILGDSWALHARVYYTFEALGITDKIHTPFFDALHRERKRLNSVDAVAKWVEQTAGVSADTFKDTYASFAVDSHTRNASLMTNRYQITGVPSIIVDGRYVTTVTMAGSYDRFFSVIDHLIERAAKKQ